MDNPFVIPLGLAFIAGAIALLVELVRRVTNFSADQERAVREKRIPREEARRNAVLFITCGAIVFLALLNLSVTYVKAFRYHLERSAHQEERTLHDGARERAGRALPCELQDPLRRAPSAAGGSIGSREACGAAGLHGSVPRHVSRA